MFTWVDISYTVNHGVEIQTGGVISMGLCVTHVRSSKQKINTKSSTEAEIVGASDSFPYNIWYNLFMRHQGYLNNSNNFSQE